MPMPSSWNDGHDVTPSRGRKFRAVEGNDDGGFLVVDLVVDQFPATGLDLATIFPGHAVALLIQGSEQLKSVFGIDIRVAETLPGQGVDRHGNAGLTAGDSVALGQRLHVQASLAGTAEQRRIEVGPPHVEQLLLGSQRIGRTFGVLGGLLLAHHLLEGLRVNGRTLV